MAELGRGAIEYSFTAVCGGCLKRQPLQGSTPNAALLDAISRGWGEAPTLGVICPACVKKIAAQATEKPQDGARIILTDSRGNVQE